MGHRNSCRMRSAACASACRPSSSAGPHWPGSSRCPGLRSTISRPGGTGAISLTLSKSEKRDKYLQAIYGLTLRQYRKMEFAQKGLCKICLRPPKPGGLPLRVDHSHKTKVVRGLLCYRCNHRLLGRGLEDAFLHQQAANYLLDTFDGRLL